MDGSIVLDDFAGGAQPKASVLLIVGEPFSDDQKILILEEITKGFRCWDSKSADIDINDELAQIANRAALGEEGPNGERLIRHRSESVAIELLLNPQIQTVKKSLRGILTQGSHSKVVIFAGFAFQGSAAWVVQDGTFCFSTFSQIFKDPDVENALKLTENATLIIQTVGASDWTNALKGSDISRMLKVTVNPGDKLDNIHGILQFSAYIGSFLKPVPLSTMLQASDVVGNISFARPVLYIFPGSQGDSALFGMKGFNMLVNGGFSRRSCFWDFTRHLDTLDAVLLTHLGPDNIFGIKSVLERKSIENIHPEIGYIYMNHGKYGSGNGDTKEMKSSEASLLLNLADEGSKVIELGRQIGITPQTVSRPLSGNLEPVNLFHKVGLGRLDMYVLNPVTDSKELKDFLTQWSKQSSNFGAANGIPIPNVLSVCALLVVRPTNANDKITRILFPGNAPQHKILEGLERVKNLDFLKHANYCEKDSHKPKKAPAAGNGRVGSASKKTTSVTSAPKPVTVTKAEPPKKLEPKAPATKPAPSTTTSAKTTKHKKEDSNKRTSSTKEKVKLDEKEKEDKTKSSKSSASSSPSKASVKTASPVKTPSTPVKTPTTTSPDDGSQLSGRTEPVTVDSNHIHSEVVKASVIQEALINEDNRQADSPEALPEPVQFGSDVDNLRQQVCDVTVDERQNLQDLGIYDDEEGEGSFAQLSVDPSEAERLKLQELGIYDDDDDNQEYDGKEYQGESNGDNDDEEEVQPQPLPEPVAVIESPCSVEADTDNLNKLAQPAALDQFYNKQELVSGAESEATDVQQLSQLEPSEQGLEAEPDSELDREPEIAETEILSKTAQEVQAESSASDSKTTLQEDTENVQQSKPSISAENVLQLTDPADVLLESIIPSQQLTAKESSGFNFQTEAIEEPFFALEPEVQTDSSAIEQNIQYGITNGNGFQMGGIREEEEEEAVIVGKDVEAPAHKTDSLDKAAMDELGIYGDDEDDQEAEVGEESKEAFVYEKDVNLDDEEVCRGPIDQTYIKQDSRKRYAEDSETYQVFEGESCEVEQDQNVSNIPEAFEKDETPTPVESALPAETEIYSADKEEKIVGSQEEEQVGEFEEGASEHFEAGREGSADHFEVETEELVDFETERIKSTNSFEAERDELDIEAEREGSVHHFEAEREGSADHFEAEREGSADHFEVEREGSADHFEAEREGSADHFEAEREGSADHFEAEREGSADHLQEREESADHFEADRGSLDGFDAEEDESAVHVEAEREGSADQFEAEESIDQFEAESEEQLDEFEAGDADTASADRADADSGREDTDSIDGGTPDDEKDVDEALAHHQYSYLQEQNSEQDDFPATGYNPFIGIDGQPVSSAMTDSFTQDLQPNPFEVEEQEEGAVPTEAQRPDEFDPLTHWGQPVGLPSPTQPVGLSSPTRDDFDPLAEWGQPLGLPSPPPPETKTATDGKRSAGGDSKKPEPKKASPAKPKTQDKRPPSASKTVSKTTNGSVDPPKSAKPSNTTTAKKPANLDTSRSTRPPTAPAARSLDTSRVESKSRPATASPRKPTTTSAVNNRASPAPVKMPSLPPLTPFYVDLTYIPNHGDSTYCDTEFFKRIRARYYVLSSLTPNPTTLQALMEAKPTWEGGSDLEVTIIPTYETDTLRHWMALHKDQLAQQKIDIAPAASRCTVRLQDHEDSCFTYRLEF